MLRSLSILLFFTVWVPELAFAQFVDRSDSAYQAYYYENGNISSEGYLENGKPNRYWITYYPNQLRKSEGNRKDFLLDGVWKFYDKKGNLSSTISYSKGVKDGKSLSYEDCFIQQIDEFEDNVQVGIRTILYPDSSNELIKATIPFKNGVKDGLAKYYAKDGRLIELVEYQKGFVAKRERINRLDEKGNKQGLWKEYFDNGRLKEEKRFKDDQLNGYVKKYNSRGKLEEANLYLEGEKRSEEENLADFDIVYTYYDDGSIESSTTYSLGGKKNGVAQYFDKEGNVIDSEIYQDDYLIAKGIINKNGVREGKWETFYLNGNTKSKGEYKGGEKYGKWVYYFSNGEKEQEGYYDQAGRFTGKWVWYYENGNILREEEFLRGEEDGFLTEYDINGNVITSGEYLEGEKEGEWTYQLNDHQESGKYLYGERNGYWEFKHPNGKIAFEGNFQSGRPHGEHNYYNEFGVLIKEENYSFGVKDGKWRWFDDNGIEYLSIVYKDGEEKKVDGSKFKLK